MPTSHKPRHRYVPKRVDPNPVDLAISNTDLLTQHQKDQFIGPLLAGFDAFRTGRATAQHWCDLADAMKVAGELASRQIVSNHADKFRAACAALGQVHQRQAAGGSYTLYPAELCALDDAVWLHQLQLQHCGQSEMQHSIAAVTRRARQALAGNAGNASPATMVCAPGWLGRPQATPQATA